MATKKKYKYPFIPREYYPAVMFACKMIREDGYFNQAIEKASNYYDVDSKKVAQYVKQRQGAGQKGKTRKYNYYCVIYVKGMIEENYDDWGFSKLDNKETLEKAMKIVTVKSTSEENAIRQIEKKENCKEYSDGYHCIIYVIKPLKIKQVNSKDETIDYTMDELWENLNR